MMKTTLTPTVANSSVYQHLRMLVEGARWRKNGYRAPSPHHVKQKVLLRNGNPNAVWIETGTYLGQMTKSLSKSAYHVYSIEPEPLLHTRADAYFRYYQNVTIIKGLSERILVDLLPKLSGDINFWLDGHYSAGCTHKGPQDTPILDELSIIMNNIERFKNTCIMIDDVRCFNPEVPEYSSYPSLNEIVEWANDSRLQWHIEHDIFIAKTRV